MSEKWIPIPRISRTIPFGYKEDPEDPNILLPVDLELDALMEAKKHIKIFSLRQVADWLYQVTGRSISYVGLKKRIDNEQRRQRKTHALKNWTRRAKEAEAAAKKIQERLGARET